MGYLCSVAENVCEWYPHDRSIGFPFWFIIDLSAWYRIAPIAYWEASTSRMNCHVTSGTTSTGSEVTRLMRVVSAIVHSSVQVKIDPFFKRFVSGFAILANSGMNSLWNPTVLDSQTRQKIFLTYFRLKCIKNNTWILAKPNSWPTLKLGLSP